ncbi:methylmalonyl Co-A mutase-associated GTPase MeaB [Parapedomonas caeni]
MTDASALDRPTTPAAATPTPTTPAPAILAGDRRALAKAITLIESSRPDHEAQAQALLADILPHTGRAIRVGLSGAPGVGKSSFIEAFGKFLIEAGLKVAVLAIDPSSTRSGGSILGDKTRMEQLSADPRAFIRPSPSGGSLGGVARRTREAMLLTEAAGYDVVLVETVGVGQSETAVADMVDMFVVLVSPGGGDELQGIKRGIMELADLVVVTKADGDLEPAAKRAQGEYRAGLHLMRPKTPGWTPHVLLTSSVSGRGLDNVWQQIGKHHDTLAASGELARLRRAQARAWMWTEIEDQLGRRFRAHPAVASRLAELEAAVTEGRMPPTAAAQALIAAFEPG